MRKSNHRLWNAVALSGVGFFAGIRLAGAQTFQPSLSYVEVYHDLNDSTRGSPHTYEYSPTGNQVPNNTSPTLQMNGDSISNGSGGSSLAYGGVDAISNSLNLSFQSATGTGVTQSGAVPATGTQQPSAAYTFFDLVWYLPSSQFTASPYTPLISYQFPFGGVVDPGGADSFFGYFRFFDAGTTAPTEITSLETFPSANGNSALVSSTSQLNQSARPGNLPTGGGLGNVQFAQSVAYPQTNGGTFTINPSGNLVFTTNSPVASGHYIVMSGYVGYQALDPTTGASSSFMGTGANNLMTVENLATFNPSVDNSFDNPDNWGGVVPNGPAVVAGFTSLSDVSFVTLNSDESVGGLLFSGEINYTLGSNSSSGGGGGTLTLNGNGGTGTGSFVNSANIQVTGNVDTIAVPLILGSNVQATITNSSDELTISGNIAGAGGLGMSGAGTLVLSGTNSYTGGTQILSGTVQAGSSSALGNITNGLTLFGGTLDLNGNSITVGTLYGAGTVDNLLSGSMATLTVGADGSNSTFDGNIQNTSGVVNLVKIGAGTLFLGGSNTYSGSTTVNAGVLVLGGNQVLAGGIVNNSSLVITGNNSIAHLSGIGSLTVGDGTTPTSLALSGAGDVINQTSLTILNAASLDIGADAIVLPDNGSPSSVEAAIQQYVINGLSSTATGGAIVSSFLKNNPNFGIAYADGSDAGVEDPTLPPGKIVIEADLLGDSDLNGTVNFHDLQNLLGGFGKPGVWDQGNFNNHSTVDFNDLQLLLGNYADSTTLGAAELNTIEQTVGQFGYEAIANSNGVGFNLVAIPEPATLALALAGTSFLLGRRRGLRGL